MRRKSERVVKTSPTKKTEPTNRRTSRRGRKSPEKTVNDDESENSSDQASSSDNEPEEVVVVEAPKRSRRSSRTIEKSSSAEEVKATTTTTRTRRRGAKKEQDIQEEEDAEADQTSTTVVEPKPAENVAETVVEKIGVTSVDSSTEPATSQIEVENSNNSVEDDSEKQTAFNEIVHEKDEKKDEKESEEKTEIEAPVEPVKVEESQPVESSKTRRRTLKRIERVVSREEVVTVPETTEKDVKEQENEVEIQEKSPEKKSIEEVKTSDDTKATETEPDTPTNSSDKHNGRNVSDAADTTAKDTTASEAEISARQIKKKPIVRKRKWLTNKTAAPKVQEIAISTDSLKGLISDVKPVPLSDVQLDSSPEADHESDDVKVVSSTSADYNQRSDDLVESTDDVNAPTTISTSRKISIVNEPETEQPLSPAKHNPCNILYITNLVRPFTVLQLKSLLQRTGKIAEDGFWIDKIKSKCFVKYETEDEAVETRHALHGIRWPSSNPKCLNVDFGTEILMEKAIASTADEVKAVQSRDDRIVSSNNIHEAGREKALAAERPVREWDLGKKDSQRPREAERLEREKEREQKPLRDSAREIDRERERARENDRDGERNRNDRRRRSASPPRKFVKKDNEPPLRLLDDLFRKTKTAPCIYWLPLTSEQIAVRVEERKKAIERREIMRKEREKEREREEAEERNRRREREKRREESEEKKVKRRDEAGEGSKRRDESRERSKRRDDSRERSKRRDDSRDHRDQRHKDDKRRRY